MTFIDVVQISVKELVEMNDEILGKVPPALWFNEQSCRDDGDETNVNVGDKFLALFCTLNDIICQNTCCSACFIICRHHHSAIQHIVLSESLHGLNFAEHTIKCASMRRCLQRWWQQNT